VNGMGWWCVDAEIETLVWDGNEDEDEDADADADGEGGRGRVGIPPGFAHSYLSGWLFDGDDVLGRWWVMNDRWKRYVGLWGVFCCYVC